MYFYTIIWAVVFFSMASIDAAQTSISESAQSNPFDSAVEKTKIVGTTVLSASNDNIRLTKTPAKSNLSLSSSSSSSSSSSLSSSSSSSSNISPPPQQTWDTAVLCKHLANITGVRPSDPAENIIEEPIEAKCFPGFACVNGICTGGMSCKCHEGWAGLFCQAPCPTDCVPGGECVTSTNNQAICVCNETSKYTPGIGCEQKPPGYFTTTTPAPAVTPGNLRPLAERECFGAFTCLYGYCQFSSLQCACDPGWKGQLCDQPCEFNCSGHGRCYENDEFVLSCVCDSFHTGQFCEILIKQQHGSQQNFSLSSNNEVDTSGWYDNKVSSHQTRINATVTGTDNSTNGNNSSSERKDVYRNLIALRPFKERECEPGFVCERGYCQRDQRVCLCDQGWGGELCNITCDYSCENGGTCMVNKKGSWYCRCPTEFSGKKCHLSETEAVDKDINDQIQDPWKKLEEQTGELPPLFHRMCQPEFICAYGVCSHDDNKMECICDPRFTDKYCQMPCTLPCKDNRHCEFKYNNETEECVCNAGYFGVNCTKELTAQDDTTSAVIAATVIGIVIVSLLLVLFTLYKKQNMTMMTILHWFQRYEDNDKCDYDAFVVYSSADQDRQFVIQTLVPKLEGRMCFTLSIHQQNVSSAIAAGSNNIPDLIKKSRRIILILSPSFTTNEHDNNDQRVALIEIFQNKQKTITILLGDMEAINIKRDSFTNNLIKSTSVIQFPPSHGSTQEFDKFWKRLKLSMPKKRLNTLEAGKSYSCLRSPSVVSQLVPEQDTKAPLEIRLFTNNCLKTQLLQRIVRVPASKLDNADKDSIVGCSTLSKNLVKSNSNGSDYQERDLVNIDVDSYHHHLRQTDSSMPIDIKEGVANNELLNPDAAKTNGNINYGYFDREW